MFSAFQHNFIFHNFQIWLKFSLQLYWKLPLQWSRPHQVFLQRGENSFVVFQIWRPGKPQQKRFWVRENSPTKICGVRENPPKKFYAIALKLCSPKFDDEKSLNLNPGLAVAGYSKGMGCQGNLYGVQFSLELIFILSLICIELDVQAF